MKPTSAAVSYLFICLAQTTQGFTPIAPAQITSSLVSPTGQNVNMLLQQQHQISRRNKTHLFASMSYDDEDDEDEDDEDDDDYPTLTTTASARSTPLPKLDPYDPNPPIKPRPGRYGFQSIEAEMEAQIDVFKLVQTMTEKERSENLKIMRQIKKSDLADLRLRKDHAGWVDANNDLKARTKADPWYRVNDMIKDAYLMGDDEKVEELKKLAEKLDGPPPGVKVGPRGYALHTEIYDVGVSASRTASALEQSILEERVKRGRAMAAERAKNMEKEQKEWEDMMRNPGEREDKEAKERRERTMARLRAEIEEDNKKREERAKEMLGQLPEAPKDSTTSLEKALEEAKADVKRLRKMRREGRGLGEVSDDADLTFMNPEDRMAAEDAGKTQSSKPKGSAARAREAAAAEASGLYFHSCTSASTYHTSL